MLEFIKNHYELIGSCLLLLISVLINIFKKKPIYNKLDEIKTYILELLPSIIDSVEVAGNGSKKKNLVLKEVQLAIAKRFGFTAFEEIEGFVSEAIEAILATPQKK